MKTKSNYLLYLAIALMPILSLYNFIPIINFGYFILLVSIILHSLVIKKIFINSRLLFILLVFSLINLFSGLINNINISSTFNNSLSIVFFSFIASILCVNRVIDLNKLYKVFEIVAIVSTFFLFYQLIMYNFFNTVVEGSITFLTPIENRFQSIYYGRPTSFFYEPAHYVIYIAPVLYLSIKLKKWITSSILSLGLLFSTSTTGIIFAIVILFMLLFYNRKYKYLYTYIIIIIFILFYSFRIYDHIVIFEKLSISNLVNSIRTFGTLHYLKYFNFFELIFGVGLNRVVDFSILHGFSAYNYANAYIYSFISFGIIGFVIFIYLNINIYISLNRYYKSFFIIFFLTLFSDQILFNQNFLLLLIWIYSIIYSMNDINCKGKLYEINNTSNLF